MFREMRRKRQLLTREECDAILIAGTSGVLALSGDDGYPYAVPISYVYQPSQPGSSSLGRLLFHCAKTGHKIDAIARCDKASFTVIEQDHIVPEEFTTYFRSVIAFGRIRILSDTAEVLDAIMPLAQKYSPKVPAEARDKEIAGGLGRMVMLELTVEHLTGKEAIELVRSRDQ